MRYEGAPEPKARLEIKLKSPFTGDQSTAWARVLGDGGIELGLFDFSDEAQSSMGHDVAWTWTIEPAQKPRLLELLEERTGRAIRDYQTLLDVLAQNFSDVHAIRAWLREKQIPFKEEFDSRA